MLQTRGGIAALSYSSIDFRLKTEENTQSSFDIILKQSWTKAEKQGALRYKLNIVQWKVLEGQYGFLAQLNPDRGFNRRSPEHIFSMSQPFDSGRFNFTKLLSSEILFEIDSEEKENTNVDIVAVNSSPIEQYHSLLLIKYLQCLPQCITEYSIKKAIHLFLLSGSSYLRLAYNSLCGYASVNHLHWHLYYLQHQMPLEYINVYPYVGPFYLLEDFPSKGFCLKLSSVKDVTSFVSWSFLLLNYLQQEQIAHNVYVTRAKTTTTKKEYDDVRMYIWARTSQIGAKDVRLFNPAACELFGHLSIKSVDIYDSLNEETVKQILEEITKENFVLVKEALKKLVENKPHINE